MDVPDTIIQKALIVLTEENKVLKDSLEANQRTLKVCCEFLTVLEIKVGSQLNKAELDYLHQLIAFTNMLTKK